jgi:hypothetical protein
LDFINGLISITENDRRPLSKNTRYREQGEAVHP